MRNNKESSSSSSSCPEASISVPGCGNGSISSDTINLNITTTTGGNFSVLVDVQNSIENLKKIIAKKLKVAKDRICLLHRERELHDGNLKENGLMDGSKIILIPNVETGLLAQRPENTVMQALESLNDAQVNDFLSGKIPLNLSMRLGDHMMLIQLQLSTVSPSSPPHNRLRSRSRTGRVNTSSSTTSTSSSSSSFSTSCNLLNNSSNENSNQLHQLPITYKKTIDNSFDNQNINQSNHSVTLPINCNLSDNIIASSSSGSNNPTQERELNSFLNKHGFENIQNVSKDICQQQQCSKVIQETNCETTAIDHCYSLNNPYSGMRSINSPIKSVPKLVPIPLKSAPEINNSSNNYLTDLRSSHIESASMCSDPISAKLTSCLCKRLDDGAISTRECETNQCQSKHDMPSITTNTEETVSDLTNLQKISTDMNNTVRSQKTTKNFPPSSSTSSLLHKTVNNPINKHKTRGSSACHIFKKNLISFDRKTNSNNFTNNDNVEGFSNENEFVMPTTNSEVIVGEETKPTITATDARALAEASRNLTQTLRKLSKEVFTNKVDLSDQAPRKSNSGAVLESMKNHGKGIYSGTFSGTLNPALQDQYGRPKRDISTVIHILNDLLSATPQYNRDTRISFESSSSSSLSTSNRGLNNKQVNNSTCAYGECDGHASSSMSTKSFICSPNTLNGTTISTGTSSITTGENNINYLSISNNCQDIPMSDDSMSSSLNLSSSDECNLCTCNSNFKNLIENNSNNIVNYDNITRMCNKCSVDLENSKTKCKLDQLRLVMQQKKQKREARKLKATPYGARMLGTAQHCSLSPTGSAVNGNSAASVNGQISGVAAGTATNSSTSSNTITPIAPPSEVSPNHIVEEVDTAA